MRQIVTDEVFMLLMRVAMGEQLDAEETALVRAFLESTKKS